MDAAHDPIHPGEILAEEFRGPLGISQYWHAKTIGVAPTRIGEIVYGTRNISPDTALRLSRTLGTSDRFWLNLQTRYYLERALDTHRTELEQIHPLVTT